MIYAAAGYRVRPPGEPRANPSGRWVGKFGGAGMLCALMLMPYALRAQDDLSVCSLTGLWVEEDNCVSTRFVGDGFTWQATGTQTLAFDASCQEIYRVLIWRDTDIVYNGCVEASLTIPGMDSEGHYRLQVVASAAKVVQGEGVPRSQTLSFRGLMTTENRPVLRTIRQESTRSLLFIGDSILLGVAIRGREKAPLERNDVRSAFPEAVSGELDAQPVRWGFAGMGLGEAVDLFVHYPEARWWESFGPPQAVIINMGANDRMLSQRAYIALLGRLIDHIKRAFPKAPIILTNFYRMKPNRLAALTRLAQRDTEKRTRVFDARAYILGYTDNGVHPDIKSHAAMARAFSRYLQLQVKGNVQ